MKIKTLLVCFITLSVITLDSCSKGKYSSDFVGEYELTVSPLLKLNNAEQGEQDFPITPIENLPCIIEQCTDSNNGLHLYVGRSDKNLEFIANCDEMGMTIYAGKINKKIETEEYGKILLNVSMPMTSPIETPINSYITCQPFVSGEVTFIIEEDTITSPISGNIKVDGIKIDYKE